MLLRRMALWELHCKALHSRTLHPSNIHHQPVPRCRLETTVETRISSSTALHLLPCSQIKRCPSSSTCSPTLSSSQVAVRHSWLFSTGYVMVGSHLRVSSACLPPPAARAHVTATIQAQKWLQVHDDLRLLTMLALNSLQSYVYPKLVLLKARLTALRRHDLSLYDRLLLSLHSLVESHPKIYANTKQLIEYRSQSLIVDPTAEISLPGSSGNEDSDVEKALRERNEQPANDVPPHDREDAASEDTLVEGKATPEPVNVTADLQESLSRLAEKLSAYAHRDKAESANEKLIDDDEDDAALPEPSASQLLSKSLEQFTAKLTNETFYSSAPSYPSSMYGYNYAAGSSTTMSGMDKELMVKVKNDIRMLKGMFLTRWVGRNRVRQRERVAD